MKNALSLVDLSESFIMLIDETSYPTSFAKDSILSLSPESSSGTNLLKIGTISFT
mgnify:CR=1 FL=1